jgi:hypothetical protein
MSAKGGGEVAVPQCQAGDVEVTVRWEPHGTGLRGQVVVRNVSARTCRVPGKPAVRPLSQDGTPLDVDTINTLEFVSPGYVDIAPGEETRASLRWPSWCGPAASDRALVTLEDGDPIPARVTGPVQPSCASGKSSLLWSFWFGVED